MEFARVIGSAVSTIKTDSLTGRKLLVVRSATPSDELYGEPFVAVDAVGAAPIVCSRWRSPETSLPKRWPLRSRKRWRPNPVIWCWHRTVPPSECSRRR